MTPPERVQAEAQVLLVMLTFAGAPLKVGQEGPLPPILSTVELADEHDRSGSHCNHPVAGGKSAALLFG